MTYKKGETAAEPRPGHVPVLRAGNIGPNGLVLDDLVYVPAKRVAARQMVQRHDVVIATSSGSLDVVGKAVSVTQDFLGGFGAFCKVLRPSTAIHPRYFGHYFQTRTYRQAISHAAAGINIHNLRAADLDELTIRLPGVEEQRRIAAILDAADELRANRRESLALLDSLTESIFIDMFGEPDERWPVVAVESLAADIPHAIRTGPFGSDLLHSEFVDEGVAVLGIDNAVQNRFEWGRPRFITEEKFENLRRYQVRPGDVLVTIMATCGRVAVVPDDIPTAINTKHLCCITLDQGRCMPVYLWAAFRFDAALRRQLGASARGAVMPGLNGTLIKTARLTLPSIEAQLQFAKRVRELDRLGLRYVQAEGEHDALFASLQHRAFRGEL